MADGAVRVALLARPGKARDQLRRALDEAGAQIVAEGDPGDMDPVQVESLAPNVFLISLEPAIEPALERFEHLLSTPGVEVMFDEAEVTDKLDGWDLNRWARHIASKLTGSEGLPPAPGGSQSIADAEIHMAPGLPPTPAELMDHAKLEDYTADSSELADWVPSSPSLTEAKAPEADPAAEPEFSGSWQNSELPSSASDSTFELDNELGMDLDLDLGALDFPSIAAAGEATFEEPLSSLQEEPAEPLMDMELSENIRFSSFEKDTGDSSMGDLDADVAELAAQLEAFEQSDSRTAAADPDFTIAQEKTASQSAPSPSKSGRFADSRIAASNSADPSLDFSQLALAPEDSSIAHIDTTPIVAKFSSETVELSLTPIDGHEGFGAVLILAGLGGPDAVRQLLSSLPDKLQVPVLLYQHLEVGKHERLVEQLAKKSKLPVVLAEAGGHPEAGKVTLLPAGMTAVAGEASLVFEQGDLAQLISGLPPLESMIIVLSGADMQLVPMIVAVKEAGGLVLAQDPDVCFDATASQAMRSAGAAVYPALGLAGQISARWPL